MLRRYIPMLFVFLFIGEANAQSLIIHYATGQYQLTEANKHSIDSLLGLEKSVGNIHLAGFTDNTGSDAVNEELSIWRVQEVLFYLQKKGIPHTQIDQKYYGRGKPLVPNTSAANRAMNRRVEIAAVFI